MANIHVDHVLPRQVILNDEIWNLVLAHSECNEMKTDLIVSNHFINKLIIRNENIMGSNHPMRHQIVKELGKTKKKDQKIYKITMNRLRSLEVIHIGVAQNFITQKRILFIED